MSSLIFHQLFEKETSTYTYLLGDQKTSEAVLIDPVIETIERDLQLIEDLGLKLKLVLDTHVHADHITASGELRKRTGAKIGVSSSYDMACPDLHLEDGQKIPFGHFVIEVLHTPGHTSGCLSYVIENMVFSGDALLIRGTGRTDFQEGSAEQLFSSIREKLFKLPDQTIVYPAHDYRGFSKSSIFLEKNFNPRVKLERTKEDFLDMMSKLKLAHPKKIQESVPANLQCGLPLNSDVLNSGVVEGIPTVTAEDLFSKIGHVQIIDVRGEDEFNSELGHIQGALLAPLGPRLDQLLTQMDQKKEIVFACRSGRRSAEAVKMALLKGFEKVFNLQGGMLNWSTLRLPTQREMGGS